MRWSVHIHAVALHMHPIRCQSPRFYITVFRNHLNPPNPVGWNPVG